MIGIMGAMPEEIEALLEPLENTKREQHGPFDIHMGELAGKRVILTRCGVGKVNAAALTQLLILKGIKLLIFTGVAGALEKGLEPGDLVISSDTLQHDVDARAFGYAAGVVPGEQESWQADARLRDLALEAAQKLPEVKAVPGRILSGDQFIASAEKVKQLRESFGGTCIEMEGAAVAQVCAKWGLPFVIIRSISDKADQEAQLDFQSFMPLAAARAKKVVLDVLEVL